MQTLLVVNAGSSSVKFQVFGIGDGGEPRRIIRGQVDGIGSRPRLRAKAADEATLVDESYPAAELSDLPTAMRIAGAWLKSAHDLDPIAVGHRVVHGGPLYDRPVLVDAAVLDRLQSLAPLAPLHQPNNLAPIRSVMADRPSLPQVACFDTAFHRSHGDLARRYAIPQRFYDEGIQRYGFHGLSYEFISTRLPQVAPHLADGKVVVAHLGSGASMCALHRLRSVESTMGFTALDGIPMGTRPGQIDPGVVLYLIEQKGMSAGEVTKLLYHECGLKGLSGISADVRELQESDDAHARLALGYFVHRVSLMTGLLAAALGGLDGIVFTAGIGENSPSMRASILERMTWLGVEIDAGANAAGASHISSPTSRVSVHVIPTDEELMIARHTLKAIGA